MPGDWIVWAVIGLALAFDLVNGMHDAANSIATIVTTRVLKPHWAVAWAAFFNFIAFLFFGLKVAATIGTNVVHPESVTIQVVTAGLVGAIFWNVVTWYGGIPSSSSHALVGGFAGAAVASAGFGSLAYQGITKIGLFILVAPVMGMVVGYILMVITYWVFRNASYGRVSALFKRLQLVSAAAYSLGHGGNDAQKTMGIIFAVLISQKWLGKTDTLPTWVVLSCHVAMGVGTLLGGWRIVKTMGQKICLLQPVHGFSAETGGAVCLYAATALGIPVSTTHTITGAIIGVGATRGARAVQWSVARRVVWAWILTIPASGLVGAVTWWFFRAIGWKT